MNASPTSDAKWNDVELDDATNKFTCNGFNIGSNGAA